MNCKQCKRNVEPDEVKCWWCGEPIPESCDSLDIEPELKRRLIEMCQKGTTTWDAVSVTIWERDMQQPERPLEVDDA